MVHALSPRMRCNSSCISPQIRHIYVTHTCETAESPVWAMVLSMVFHMRGFMVTLWGRWGLQLLHRRQFFVVFDDSPPLSSGDGGGDGEARERRGVLLCLLLPPFPFLYSHTFGFIVSLVFFCPFLVFHLPISLRFGWRKRRGGGVMLGVRL